MSAEEVAKKVVDAVDQAGEIVEETLEVIDPPHAWRCGLSRKQHFAQLVGLGVIAAGIGGFIAYKITKKKLETKYEKIAEKVITKEITEAREYYKTLHKEGDFATPEGTVTQLRGTSAVVRSNDALAKYKGKKEVPEPETEVEKNLNVFAELDEDVFDLEVEKKNRSKDEPYIITDEEFMQAEPGYPQTVLTYYMGDDVLADEGDEVVQMVDPVIGEANLKRFGHGSGDPGTVFIRNDRLSMDFEVVTSDGKYSHEVLGLEHSDDIRIERMRHRGQGGNEE